MIGYGKTKTINQIQINNYAKMEPSTTTNPQENIFYKKLANVNTKTEYLREFINKLTPYRICDHFIATEIRPTLRTYTHDNGLCETFNSYINYQFAAPGNLELRATDLLQTRNLWVIKTGDIIKVQVDYLKYFLDEVIPWLEMTHTRIILITGQYTPPILKKGIISEILLKHPNILLWICEEPIYDERTNPKFMALPIGFCHMSIQPYMDFVKTQIQHNPRTLIPPIWDKPNLIVNTPSAVHRHLPDNHIRRTHPIFGSESGARIQYEEYLTRIKNAKFIMSPVGDRDDCHRHYESIGLGAIPISNIGDTYLPIFPEDSIIRASPDEMVQIYTNQKLQPGIKYQSPNCDILTTDYWINKINMRLAMLGYPLKQNSVSTGKTK